MFSGDEDVEWLGEEEVKEQRPEIGKIPAHNSNGNIIENIETGIQGSWASNEKHNHYDTWSKAKMNIKHTFEV